MPGCKNRRAHNPSFFSLLCVVVSVDGVVFVLVCFVSHPHNTLSIHSYSRFTLPSISHLTGPFHCYGRWQFKTSSPSPVACGGIQSRPAWLKLALPHPSAEYTSSYPLPCLSGLPADVDILFSNRQQQQQSMATTTLSPPSISPFDQK